MNTLVRVALVAVVLFGATLSSGCITDPVTGESVLGMPMSEAEEIAEGNTYAPSFKAQYEGAYPDPELQRHLGNVVLKMAKNSHRPDLPWNFTILNSSDVNAFALPGGTVCITRGLLHQLESEAAFAAVMGHEIGHVNHRHSVQQMGQQALIGFGVVVIGVAGELADSEWGALGASLGAVGGQLMLLKFSRDDELQSDQRGVEYSYAAGYDPREMASVFELFKELKGGESPPELFSTHPLDDRRIAQITSEIREKYPSVEGSGGRPLKKTTPEWERNLARLRAAQEVYDVYDEASKEYAAAMQAGDTSRLSAVLGQLKNCERRLPGHALFTSGVGVVLLGMGRRGDAVRQFERAAALQPDLFEPQAYLAQLNFEGGDARSALVHARKAKEIFPHHPAGYFFEGRILDQSGNANEALTSYQTVIELTPEENEYHQFCAQRIQELEGSATR